MRKVKVRGVKGKRLRNGAIVIDYKQVHTRRYVLAMWEKGAGHWEYVTWEIDADRNAFHGHYFPDLIDAVKDFADRGY